MMKKIKTLLLLLPMLAALPTQAASKELIYGISNDVVLLTVLSSGIFILFMCILTLAYMLYQSIPAMMQKRMDEAKNANSKS